LNRFSLIAFGLISYIILAKKVFPTVKEMGIWALFLAIFTLMKISNRTAEKPDDQISK
jgi:hypothetical protein